MAWSPADYTWNAATTRNFEHLQDVERCVCQAHGPHPLSRLGDFSATWRCSDATLHTTFNPPENIDPQRHIAGAADGCFPQRKSHCGTRRSLKGRSRWQVQRRERVAAGASHTVSIPSPPGCGLLPSTGSEHWTGRQIFHMRELCRRHPYYTKWWRVGSGLGSAKAFLSVSFGTWLRERLFCDERDDDSQHSRAAPSRCRGVGPAPRVGVSISRRRGSGERMLRLHELQR